MGNDPDHHTINVASMAVAVATAEVEAAVVRGPESWQFI